MKVCDRCFAWHLYTAHEIQFKELTEKQIRKDIPCEFCGFPGSIRNITMWSRGEVHPFFKKAVAHLQAGIEKRMREGGKKA